ncbi:hypothetical protein CDEST_15252 [Colletotrichum destructivum]|uniref:Uncharacterized protein n=1 Tax=Colletotrichum destructivum TaxID=34406 RepID=A0AAX4J3T6_9PEZI|nr:hypothetical protein CDEST_15252 [Colletotrichum destructivum]
MANTPSSSLLGNIRYLLLFFLLHVLLINASPTAALVPTKRNGVRFLTFDQSYEGRVKKGQYFNKLFPLEDEKAAEYIFWYPYKKNTGDVQPLFKFTDSAVKRLKLEILKVPEYGTDLDNAFADKYHQVDQTKAGVYNYRHDRKFGKDKKKPTMSSYSNVLVPASGAIIFVDNFSPTARNQEWNIGNVPELDKLSDIAFFQWIDACKTKNVDPKTLKLMFISHVVHDATYKIVVDALREAGHKRMPSYAKKIVFSMEAKQGQAILGSVWGSALSWMLIQHKTELGLKKITEVAVWGLRLGFALPETNTLVGSMNMRFTVKDA